MCAATKSQSQQPKRPVGRPRKERIDDEPADIRADGKHPGRPAAKPLFVPNPDVYTHNGKIVSH